MINSKKGRVKVREERKVSRNVRVKGVYVRKEGRKEVRVKEEMDEEKRWHKQY